MLATATLGQPVTISGPISLTLLPQPVLTAARVNVGGGEPTDLSIHVDALRLRIAFWPLIGGRVDARELVLRGPDLHIPWPTEPGMLRPRPPAWLAAFAARIENGRLTIGQLAFTGIDATLATLETGALSASGTARFSGQPWHFTSRLTAAGADGAAGLNVTLDGLDKANGLGASFTGQLAPDGTLAGTIASRGPNLAVLLPTPPVPFRADGRLTVRSGLAAVDGLALEIGGSPANGAVALRVAPTQRLDIALAASRLDLDAWLPVLLRAGTTIAGIDVPIGFDFSAEAAPLGGGTLEHVRAAFDLTGKDLVVREASALLPGNGTLRLSGRVARDDPAHPRFDGDARLAAPVLRSTLRWLDAALPGTLPPRLLAALPEGVAQRAELAAHVVAGVDEVVLRRLSGTLDDVPMSGTVGLKRGEPPAFTVDLSLDRLALDPWLPRRLPNPGRSVQAGVRPGRRTAAQYRSGDIGRNDDRRVGRGCGDRGRQHPAAPARGYGARRALQSVGHARRWRQAERWQAQRRDPGCRPGWRTCCPLPGGRRRRSGKGRRDWMCRSPDRRRRLPSMCGWRWPMRGWRRTRSST